MTTITGHDAIAHAARTGAVLRKCADPTGDGARDITIEEAREIACEDPCLVWCADDAATEAACASLRAEMSRVFGAHATAESLGDGIARVLVDGWPETMTYRTQTALDVLGVIADGAGESERGDANVCTALETAGAVVETAPRYAVG